jgi:3-oxoacyl-[acyl-carrier-protein] synthase III
MTFIEAIAHSLPARVLTNEELKADFPGWDFQQLEKAAGVFSRRVCSDNETALDFALRACEQLDNCGSLKRHDIDAVVFCTQTPDYIMPPNSCLLHGKLELKPEVLAFDINLGCSGYMYGLQVADSLIQSGAVDRVLLATSDTSTRYIHPGDRATRCLFGDGGAVTVLARSQNGPGIRDIACGTAGKYYRRVMIPAGGMRTMRSPETRQETVDDSGNVVTAENLHMDGLGVLSFFNSAVPAAVRKILERNHLTIDEIDLFIFHQASQVALDTLLRVLRIPPEKMVYDLSDVGNLTSSSIPVALSRAWERGQAKCGQLALLCGFGQGFSWGTAVIDL